MKKTILSVLTVGLMAAATSAFAKVPTAPKTGDSGSSAELLSGASARFSGDTSPTRSLTAGTTFVRITPVIMDAKHALDWMIGADMLIADAKAGTLRTNRIFTGTGQYIVVTEGKINWFNLVTSPNTPMSDGILNPPAPMNNGKPRGSALWQLIEVTSTEDISLAELQLQAESASDGGQLNALMLFHTNGYSAQAIGITADGQTISSGPSTQKVRRIILLTCPKLFNGGGTQAGLDEVKGWVDFHVQSKGDYVMNYTATMAGDASTTSTAQVSIKGAAPAPAPYPVIDLGTSAVWAGNGQSNRTYRFYTASSPVGPWAFYKTATGTNRVLVSFTERPAGFFKVENQ